MPHRRSRDWAQSRGRMRPALRCSSGRTGPVEETIMAKGKNMQKEKKKPKQKKDKQQNKPGTS